MGSQSSASRKSNSRLPRAGQHKNLRHKKKAQIILGLLKGKKRACCNAGAGVTVLETPVASTAAASSTAAPAMSAAPATTAAASTTASAPAAEAAAIATAATRTSRLWTSFVHLQCPAIEIETVKLLDSALSILAGSQFDKSEAARTPGAHVANHAGGFHLEAVAHEKLLQILICRLERQVPDIKLGHLHSLGRLCEQRGKERGASARRTRPMILEGCDVRSLQTFRPARYLEFNSLAFIQGFVTISLNGGEMYKHVFARLTLDKSKAFAGVKPLHCSLFFH